MVFDMRILIDGDACPDKHDIHTLAKKYNIDMMVYMDYAHMMNEQEYAVTYVDIGNDHVDMKILNDAKQGDIVVTQDYGLASLLLLKECLVLHPKGKTITQRNIDELLMMRYLGSMSRRQDKHVKGPKKRTTDIKQCFMSELECMIKKQKTDTRNCP